MAEKQKEVSRLGIAVAAVAAAALIVAAGMYLYRAKGEVRAPEGLELSENDKAKVVHIYDLLEAAEKLGENDPGAGTAKAREAVAELEKMDGWEMECGAVFRKESAPLLSAYALLTVLSDRAADCEAAEKYRGELSRLMKEAYIVFPFRLVGPMRVMTGKENYYKSARERNNEMLLRSLGEPSGNCPAEGGKAQ